MRLLFAVLLINIHFATPYITCEIQGQLGNQMFQTAAALAFALDHGYEARFPSLKNAINAELNLATVFHRLNTSALPPETECSHHSEIAYNIYTPIQYTREKNLCLHGYFAHEKYFSHHAKFIKELFGPTEDILNQIYEKYGEVLKKTTVALHVRTFFPDHFDPNNGIGRTNWDYFINAIHIFPEEYAILIFSDCPEETKKNFPLIGRPNMYFIEGNPHYIDFYLMSLCNHQIISPKSTFSWWAALLNSNPDKIVIRADDGWVEDEAFPSSWIKISTR